jgi:hypothetical protein
VIAPLIIFQQNHKYSYKSCRVKKKYLNSFLTPSGSVREEKLNIKNLSIMTPDNNNSSFFDKRNEFADSSKNEFF